jgi:hypothetical protein
MTSRCFPPLNSMRRNANSHPSSPMTLSRISSRSSTVAGLPRSLKFCRRKPVSTAPRDVEQSGVVSEYEDHPQITTGTTAWGTASGIGITGSNKNQPGRSKRR